MKKIIKNMFLALAVSILFLAPYRADAAALLLPSGTIQQMQNKANTTGKEQTRQQKYIKYDRTIKNETLLRNGPSGRTWKSTETKTSEKRIKTKISETVTVHAVTITTTTIDRIYTKGKIPYTKITKTDKIYKEIVHVLKKPETMTDIKALVPLMAADKKMSVVFKEYEDAKWNTVIDPYYYVTGHCDFVHSKIILQKADDVAYHEMGHFLGAAAHRYDGKKAWVEVYNAEKDKYVGYNKSYVTSSASEYFAESVKDYYLNRAALKKLRPRTYAAVEESLRLANEQKNIKFTMLLLKAYTLYA